MDIAPSVVGGFQTRPIDDLVELLSGRICKVFLTFGATMFGAVRFSLTFAFRAFPDFARLSQIDDLSHQAGIAAEWSCVKPQDDQWKHLPPSTASADPVT